MTIYYFDPNAVVDGSGAGTPTSPRNVLTAFQGTIVAGDTLRIKRGSTYTATVSTTEAGATGTNHRTVSVANFTIEAYYNSDGTDDTTKPRPVLTLSSSAVGTVAYFIVLTTAALGFKLRNIVFQSCNLDTLIGLNSGWVCGAEITNVDVIDQLYNDITQSAPSTFAFTGGTSSVITGAVTFTDVLVRNMGRGGIFMRANPATFNRVTVKDVAMKITSGDSGDCISQQNQSTPGACLTILKSCLLDHSKAATKHCLIADSAASGNSGIIYAEDSTFIGASHYNYADGSPNAPGNVLLNVQGSLWLNRCTLIGGKKQIFNSDSVGLNNSGAGDIYGNLFIYELPDSGASAPNSSICLAGVGGLASTLGPVKFRNNTCINTSSIANTASITAAAVDLNVQGTATATEARNNIFSGYATGVRKTTTSAIERYNLYENIGQAVRRRDTDAADSLGTGSATTTNAGLNAAYRPSSISPAYHAGIHIDYTLNKDGRLFNNPPSIGAYEYVPPRGTR